MMDLRQTPNSSEKDGEHVYILDIWNNNTGENIAFDNFETSKCIPLRISEQIELFWNIGYNTCWNSIQHSLFNSFLLV